MINHNYNRQYHNSWPYGGTISSPNHCGLNISCCFSPVASADCLLSTISNRSYQRWPPMKIKFRPWKLMVDFFFEFRSIFEVFIAVLKHPADSVLLEEVCQTQNRGRIVESVKHTVGIVNKNTASGQKHVSKIIKKQNQKKYVLFKLLRLRYKLDTCPNLCYNVHVQSATQWTSSVQTLHMPKPVISFLFKGLLNGLLPCILYTCPDLR